MSNDRATTPTPLTCEEAKATLAAAEALCAEQANDEGLWFMAETAPEAYLQQELRRLHAVIERWPT